MKSLITILMTLVLAGCANGYSKFYSSIPGATPEVIASTRVAPPPVTPLLEHSQSFPNSEQYAARGYSTIGYSSFSSGSTESDDDAIKQGQKVGADLVVVVNPSYAGSVTNQMPVTTPTTSTSYTTGSATAYGSGGYATARGNSTTTTYGSSTTYIPVTVNRYNYGAVYYVKRSYIFGANWRELTNDERAKIQSNSGVFVTSVVNDSPAFRNDVLAGDIILKIDAQAVYGGKAGSEAIMNKRGKQVAFTIFRNGELIEKNIKLLP